MVSTLRETSTDIQAQSDKLLGGLMLSVAAFVFAYYTAWAILLPFLDPYLDPFSPIHQLFPRRKWAIILPSVLLLVGISGVSLFFGKVVWSEARKRRAKELKRGS